MVLAFKCGLLTLQRLLLLIELMLYFSLLLQLLLLRCLEVCCIEVERVLSVDFDHAFGIFFLGANVGLLVGASRLWTDTFLL